MLFEIFFKMENKNYFLICLEAIILIKSQFLMTDFLLGFFFNTFDTKYNEFILYSF